MSDEEPLKIHLNVQVNDCVDGAILMVSKEVFASVREDNTILEKIFDEMSYNIRSYSE